MVFGILLVILILLFLSLGIILELYYVIIVVITIVFGCLVLNFLILKSLYMFKHLYKPFNFLRVYYEVGSFDFAKDSSDKIWDRFRKLSVFFVENPWSGIPEAEIRDNADRLNMLVTNHLK